MSIDILLQRLDGVKGRGHGRWIAKCPAHDDRSPSLSIRETDDGTVLLKCWAGCGAADIVSAVGLRLPDLFPKSGHGKPARFSVPASDRLEVIDHEAAVVCVIADDLANGAPVTEELKDRLHMAAYRIGRARDGL